MTAPAPRPLALVTGASSGIGLELAKQFAQGGYDLVIDAEDLAIHPAAEEVRRLGAQVEAVQADLRTPAGVEELYAAVLALGRPLEAAALNAGIGRGQAFVDQPIADVLSVIDLNVRGTTHLAHLVLKDMVARNRGKVLVTSSIASTQPGAFQAVYNASKSYVQSFTLALQEELRHSGVTITSLMPGPVDTNFFSRANLLNTAMGKGPKDTPEAVAQQGYEALMSGERKVVAASLAVKVMEATTRFTPDSVKAIMHRGMAKPRS